MTVIRQGTEADIDGLLVIEEACFSIYYYGQYKFGVEEFLYYLHGPDCILLVAATDNHAVGYTAAVVRRPRAGAILHIDSIAILPEHQGKGTGRQLLEALTAEARQRRCKMLVLEVAAPNESAIAFFQSHGFREVRRLPHYYGRTLHALLMTANL